MKLAALLYRWGFDIGFSVSADIPGLGRPDSGLSTGRKGVHQRAFTPFFWPIEKIFSVAVFLVIGVKQEKLLVMGENIKSAKVRIWEEWRKSEKMSKRRLFYLCEIALCCRSGDLKKSSRFITKAAD